MAVYTQVSAEALARFLERYDVGELVSAKGIAEGVENTNYLIDTTRGRFFLTLYEKRVQKGDLPFFMALLDHLAAKGMPVPPAIKDRTGGTIQELEGRPACLIKFLPGVSLTSPSPTQAMSAGIALGQLHVAVKDFPGQRPNSMGAETWQPLLERCGRRLDEIAPGFYDDVQLAINEITSDWYADELDQCTIHADLFPDNVLMRGNEVGGLIDFYFACTDIRIYDLAITHAAWAFDATGQYYVEQVGDALIAGYESQLPLTEIDHSRLWGLASGACVRFTLSRAWDWLNTPAGAMVTRKDPLAFWRRIQVYNPKLAARCTTL